MKTLPAGLAAHVAQGTTSLAWLLKVTRTDAVVFAFTSATDDITIGGVNHLSAPGLDISSIVLSAGLDVDNLELTTLDDGTTFTRPDVLSGKWRNAAFLISRCNHRSISDGVEPIMAGNVGNVELRNGYIVAELRGLQQYLQQPIGSVTSKTCRARLGDSACGVDLSGFTHTGVLTTVLNNQTFSIGEFAGDPYISSVAMMLRGEGSNGGTTFVDESPLGATISTVYGTPTTSTVKSKFGISSILFPAYAGGRLKPTTGAAYNIPGDVTFECWAYPTVSSGSAYTPFSFGSLDANGGSVWSFGGKWYYYMNGLRITGPSVVLNAWVHLAVTRSGSMWRFFVDGVLQGTYVNGNAFNEGIISVGSGGNANPTYGNKFYGYIDDFRLTIGFARYTATFAPPIAELITSGPIYADDYFGEGIITFTSGANAGLSQKVKLSTSSGTITLSLPMILPVTVGDTVSLVAGCHKRRDEDCVDKFNNVLNFQGEPDIPGVDEMLRPAR